MTQPDVRHLDGDRTKLHSNNPLELPKKEVKHFNVRFSPTIFVWLTGWSCLGGLEENAVF
jgi:hypothetical protein